MCVSARTSRVIHLYPILGRNFVFQDGTSVVMASQNIVPRQAHSTDSGQVRFKSPRIADFRPLYVDSEFIPFKADWLTIDNGHAAHAEIIRLGQSPRSWCCPKKGRAWETILSTPILKRGRRGGLMVSALDSGSDGPGSSPGRGTSLCS